MPDIDRLLAGLTDEQREAVTTDASPLLVLAGAGSGKTRVLTRRVAYRAATDTLDPRRVLAVTFTRKAAAELTRRLAGLGIDSPVNAGTFHALAFAQLRRILADRGQEPPKLLDRKGRILATLVGRGSGAAVGAVVREIEWAQARLIPPDGYEAAARRAGRDVPLAPGELAGVYEAYGREKRRRGLVDFDDLLTRCAEAIEEDPELAGAIRWRHRHLFVDEFQDLNPAQFRLLRAWSGERPDLFAVGDDEQAIYGFGGADARYLQEFRTHFGGPASRDTASADAGSGGPASGDTASGDTASGDTGSGGPGSGDASVEGGGSGTSTPTPTVIRLTANFRSTPQILHVANAVLAPGARAERSLRSVGADGPAPRVTAYESDSDEAAGIAREIAALQREGVSFADVAVLVRTNGQTGPIEQALTAARVPAQVRGSERFLDRPVVQQGLHELAAAAEADPGLGFDAHLPVLRRLSDTRLGAADPRALATLVELGSEYASVEGDLASPDGFRAFVSAAMRRDDAPRRADAVDVLTFHRAKGLEWPVVFVAGLEDGFVPIAHAATDAARDEERRLLHVALTRAEHRLELSWARRRTFGEHTVTRERSPFLPALEQRIPEPESDDGSEGNGARLLAEATAALRAGADHAPTLRAHERDALYRALVEWRDRRARAAGVSVLAVLDDRALRTISERRPGDEDSLAEAAGLGASRLSRYAEEILEVVASHDT